LITAAWLNLFFFTLFTVLAWLRPLPPQHRTIATDLGFVGIALTVVPQMLDSSCPSLAIAIARDWLPVALMPIAYSQTGTFVGERNRGLEQTLQRFDRKLLERWKKSSADRRGWRLCKNFLELAYLLCYPLIPGGLALLYLMGHRAQSDWYWMQVLPPTYLSYAVVPFLHVLPPRLLETEPNIAAGGVRKLNLWLLRHASITFATLPSAHVAATIAASLALLCVLPVTGILFLLLSINIAIGAVVGRYHYAADVLLGALMAIAFFVMQSVSGKRSQGSTSVPESAAPVCVACACDLNRGRRLTRAS
jgi:hypothetical protein